jgi:tetratricopeptide (TPR) repeat protein
VPARKKPSQTTTKSAPRTAPFTGPAFQQYQSAVQLLQQGKYEKALAAFEKLLPTAPFALIERCRMYITTCRRQLDQQGLKFQSAGERYDYAISQLNAGFFEEAAGELKGIIADDPGADFAYYGLAVLDSITGRAQDCLDHLTQAIEINPKNRLQARSDNDFQGMVDDPRFTELLYPEVA